MIGEVGRIAEKRLARRIGGKQRPASGAMAGAKGDIVKGPFLVEAKSTVNGSLGLQRDWLSKIASEAENQGLIPALAVTFTDPTGRPRNFGSWVAVPESEFVAWLEQRAKQT